MRTVLLRMSNLGYSQTVAIGQFRSGINRDPIHSVEMDLMMHWITEPRQRQRKHRQKHKDKGKQEHVGSFPWLLGRWWCLLMHSPCAAVIKWDE